ncbi:hypothetical protein PSPO01_15708 [Paraphaeosphaeria sporulosa]
MFAASLVPEADQHWRSDRPASALTSHPCRDIHVPGRRPQLLIHPAACPASQTPGRALAGRRQCIWTTAVERLGIGRGQREEASNMARMGDLASDPHVSQRARSDA